MHNRFCISTHPFAKKGIFSENLTLNVVSTSQITFVCIPQRFYNLTRLHYIIRGVVYSIGHRIWSESNVFMARSCSTILLALILQKCAIQLVNCLHYIHKQHNIILKHLGNIEIVGNINYQYLCLTLLFGNCSKMHTVTQVFYVLYCCCNQL